MRVSIYQPSYWPSLHYFNRILNSDVFVWLDTAEFTRSVKYTNTMKIKGKSGIINMTVPILHTGKRERFIDLDIDNSQPWKRKHLNAIRHVYGKTDRYDKYKGFLSYFYGTEQNDFSMLCGTTVRFSLEIIKNWNGRFVRASSLGIDGKGSQWMLDICKRLNATEYLCGKVAYDNYLDKGAFERAGIKIVIQNWVCQEYQQIKTPFTPNLSILDLIFNVHERNRKDLLLKTEYNPI